MAVTITAGTLVTGGAVMEASDGTKVAVFVNSSGDLVVYKNIDGTPSLVDSATPTEVHGGDLIFCVEAAIDSNDDIHVVSLCSELQTRDVAYAICDLTTGFGSWEEAADYGDDAVQYGLYHHLAIVVDSNDKPRVVYCDITNYHGSGYRQAYYVDKTGASWSTPENVSYAGNVAAGYPVLAGCPSDDLELILSEGSTWHRRRRNSTWAARVLVDGGAGCGAITVTTGNAVHRFTGEYTVYWNCQEDGVFLIRTGIGYWGFDAALAGTDRYLFYVGDTTREYDICLHKNLGSGWVDGGVLQAGTYSGIIVEWAYNHENQDGEINYIFQGGSTVYYDSYKFPIDIPCDTLTLAGSCETLHAVAVDETISLDSLELTGSIPDIEKIDAGNVNLNALTLASSAVTMGTFVLLNTLSLDGSTAVDDVRVWWPPYSPVKVYGAGDLGRGGAVVKTTGGTKCAVFCDSSWLRIYKDINGSPVLVDSATPAEIFGEAAYIHKIDAAIDSNDDIHIVCQHTGSDYLVRDVAYAVCDLSTGLGTWEEVRVWSNAPTVGYCVLAVDSNDKPRVLFKEVADSYIHIFYTDRISGSWSTPEQVSAGDLDFYGPRMCMCPGDDVEAFYWTAANVPYYRRRNGTWGTQSSYSNDGRAQSVVCTTGNAVYRCVVDLSSPYDIYENNVDILYNGMFPGNDHATAEVLVGTTRYIFYTIATTPYNLYAIHNAGAGWVDDGKLLDNAVFPTVEWAYNHENQSGEINYIYMAWPDTDIYFFSLVLVHPTISCDTLTLASSPPNLTVFDDVPIVPMDSLTLAGSTPVIVVDAPPPIGIDMDSLSLASSAITCQVVLEDEAIDVPVDTLTLASSIPNLTVVTGDIIYPDTLSLVSSIPDIHIPRMMKPLTLASSLLDLIQSSGSVVMPMDSISLAGSVPALTVLQQTFMDALSLAGSVPQTIVVGGIQLNSLTLAGSPVNIDDIVGGPVWTPLNTITTSGSAPGILIAHGFLPIPPENHIITEPNYLEEALGGLEIIVDSVTYMPEMYVRESHLYQPGATWRATVESCGKSLWSDVTIKENGVTVLTGYLLKRVDERGKCHISGMDTFAKVKDAWLTGEDIETEAGQTVAYWIDFIMGYTDLNYNYPQSAHGQYVEPHISLAPLSLYDALELVIRFAGLYIWVGRQGDIVFSHIVDQSRRVIPSVHLEREKREHDEVTRHQVSVFGMGSTKFIAEGEMLGDPVERIAVIESPYVGSVADAEITAENALIAWNKHDDVRTIELPGPYPEYRVADMVTERD